MNDNRTTANKGACDADGFVLPGDPSPRLAASCCGGSHDTATSCCGPSADTDSATWRRVDWMLWGSGAIIVVSYLGAFVLPHDAPLGLGIFTHGVQEMMNLMWWGILAGMLAVGLIDRVPRQFVIGVIGRDQGTKSLVRAVLAGVLLDLCNHGVLMVGAKLYERGASLGQVFAFLIASPWNSLSLTIIIGVLMGWQWMAVFLVASLVIAFASWPLYRRLLDHVGGNTTLGATLALLFILTFLIVPESAHALISLSATTSSLRFLASVAIWSAT